MSRFVIIPFLLASACAVDTADELTFEDEGTAPDLGKADHASLALTPIDAFIGDVRFDGGLEILTSAERYTDVLGVEPPADLDFADEWVVFYGLGVRNTGGFSASIDALEYYPGFGGLLVRTREVKPGFDCIVTQALTNPYGLYRFDRPSGARWFTSRHTDESRRCGPSADELQSDLADSREAWDAAIAANGADYTYTREFHSFLGFSSRTTIVVRDNAVTERHFKSQHAGGGDATTWSELGDEVGSHAEGAPAVLIEALYDECADDVLTVDFDEHFISVHFNTDGLLQVCQSTNIHCADDCARGPSIGSIELD
jgi:hypothetical protein